MVFVPDHLVLSELYAHRFVDVVALARVSVIRRRSPSLDYSPPPPSDDDDGCGRRCELLSHFRLMSGYWLSAIMLCGKFEIIVQWRIYVERVEQVVSKREFNM